MKHMDITKFYQDTNNINQKHHLISFDKPPKKLKFKVSALEKSRLGLLKKLALF